MRISRLVAMLTIATFASATQGWAASGGTGGGFGAGYGGGFSAGIGAASIGGLSMSHGNSIGSSPSPFTSNIGTLSFGTSRSMTDIGQSRAFSGSLSDITAMGKGNRDYGYSSAGSREFGSRGPEGAPIRAIDPGLDMTKLGRIGSPGERDEMDRDIKQFDREVGIKETASSEATTAAKRRITPAERRAAQQQEEQLLTTPPFPDSTSESPSNTISPAQLFPPQTSLLTNGLIPGTSTQPLPGAVLPSPSGASLSANDVATLGGIFFPSESVVALTNDAAAGLDLSVGATVPSGISLIPLPDAALTSAEAADLGYFYNGQSVVIADFGTRSVVGVVNNAN